VSVEIESASSLDGARRAELFTSAYEGYLLPFRIDEKQLAGMDAAFDIDVDASRIASRDGELVGLGNLGVRGENAWIGGVGVVPAARRSGVGEALVLALHEQARARGVRNVWLEVISENAGAVALYEKLGYRMVRDVDVWSLPAKDRPATAREVPVDKAQARLRELRTGREPWQRADETVANYDDVHGLETDAGTAVYRQFGKHVQLLQIAGEPEALLSALRRLGRVSVVNLPENDAASSVLRALGGNVVVRQHEMLLELH
jgi:GNAT superfamily N-acetyltransferase